MPSVILAACQEWQYSISNLYHAYLISPVMKSQQYNESHYLALPSIIQLFNNLGDKGC